MFPSDFKDFPYPTVRRGDGCYAWRDNPAPLVRIANKSRCWNCLNSREVGLLCGAPNTMVNMQVKFNVAVSVEFIYIVGGGI
jgi:hypothetical protein